MTHLLIVYVHLIATCMAIGVIVMTDMRLLAKLVGYRVVIPPPERFETLMIIVATTMLVLSGAALVTMGVAANPNYLSNPKLQAKLLLVGLLVANAFALHYVTFPRLAKVRPVASWGLKDHLSVALPVGLSNSLWMYCAFLGIARPWNFSVPIGQVLAIAVALFAFASLAVLFGLRFAARDEPQARPDWIDSMKARLSDRMPLAAERGRYERSHAQDTLF
jgi:hypothetical protein